MKQGPLFTIARWTGLLFGGVFTGFLVCVMVLENSLRDYDGTVYTQVRQVELDSLDTLASATLIPTIIATAIVVTGAWKAKGRNLYVPLAALALFLLILVLTFVVNLPINADQKDWTVASPPSDWADVRDEWQTSHAVRTLASLVAFALLSFSALTHQARSLTTTHTETPLAGRS
ncbi:MULTISPECIES: anthrone oxygenase family protein [unclassified Streptomyces]|uniref:anthrone oxygenase family protein n=1 Tax=unclassified Streptomyces TaxID=2593676 RepID=UPI0036E3DDF7